MGTELRNVRRNLKTLGTEWLAETTDAVSGRILRVKSDRLRKSLELVDNTNEDPPTIEVVAEARDPRTGFPYAAYHEFESGLSYIRPSLLFLLSKQGSTKSNMKRALVADSVEGIIDELLRHGWFPGRLPNSAFRTVTMGIAGAGTTGAIGRTRLGSIGKALGSKTPNIFKGGGTGGTPFRDSPRVDF